MQDLPVSRRQILTAAGAVGAAGALGAFAAPAAAAAETSASSSRLIAYVGSYGSVAGTGGIDVFDVSAGGSSLTHLSRVDQPNQAGYQIYAPKLRTLYSVDERKTDGRGPVGPPAAVHAFAVNQSDGSLTHLNSQLAPGPFPTFLSVDEQRRVLVSAEHGSFDHVEHIVRKPGGGWTHEYSYDDAAAIMYGIEKDGSLSEIRDLRVLTGHGEDPNTSPQVAGHSQASAHAHSAVFDLSGRYVLVQDKGTDHNFVFTFKDDLFTLVSTHTWPNVTGPRHLRFDPISGHAFMTCELSSQLASLSFDVSSGKLHLLDIVKTVKATFTGYNEPADVRVHPNGKFVYVNNRGEDTVTWFGVGPNGSLSWAGNVPLAKSLNPGVAARSFAFDPSGTFLLIADRPANAVKYCTVDGATGALSTPVAVASLADPAFVTFAELRP